MAYTLIVFLLVFLAGCASAQNGGPQATPTSSGAGAVGEVTTAQGGGPAVGLPSPTPVGAGGASSPAALPADGLTLADNGKTFSMQVGDTFLLNLGMDAYEWSDVQIDHPEVLFRKIGVTVIRGAQGIYVAQAPGTAVLTTNGDPLCLKATPPCKSPSIMFSVTLVVK